MKILKGMFIFPDIDSDWKPNVFEIDNFKKKTIVEI
jgi:hypothetical protein